MSHGIVERTWHLAGIPVRYVRLRVVYNVCFRETLAMLAVMAVLFFLDKEEGGHVWGANFPRISFLHLSVVLCVK